ncbi:type VII secretion protein EccB [Mycobacterium asiaticum]|uniref:Type VII secretion protein EccB n=1 Tax=Mycobacterium asiaticum TaxID=1790 RepID=A0A1A3N1L0_MYCAS|nr:type VII secretion protein EccB [Mycobacterium asiaticum]OBK15240.1 type VII secretion protein EccB [Mycobacterium asiaticum]
MRRETTSWLHVSAHRYLTRRLECALLGGDYRTVEGSRRTRLISLTFGCVLTVVAIAGCGLLSLLQPQSGLGDARIAMGRVSGALYVRVGDTWHPVLNLASARLIAASDANPQPVRESDLLSAKHGPLLGIPGAPQLLAPPLPVRQSAWTICDGGGDAGTTVLIGPPAGPSVAALAADRAILVTTDSDSQAYLLYHGSRALVDLADSAVVRALGLSGQRPRTVSRSLLGAVPEAPPIAVPRVAKAAGPPRAWLPETPVGTVLRITRAGGDEFYVVLTAGVQRIGQLTADLLRFHDSQGSADVVTISPDALRQAPEVDILPTAGFPERAPALSVGDSDICVVWTPVPAGPAEITVGTGSARGLSAGGRAATLAQADGRGPAVDAVYLPPGHSAYVSAQGLTGIGARSLPRFLVTDAGVRFAIHDDEAARDLGLPSTAAPAPWALLAALPCGPELSRAKASVGRDTVGP